MLSLIVAASSNSAYGLDRFRNLKIQTFDTIMLYIVSFYIYTIMGTGVGR